MMSSRETAVQAGRRAPSLASFRVADFRPRPRRSQSAVRRARVGSEYWSGSTLRSSKASVLYADVE
jgi:hypothetical protein